MARRSVLKATQKVTITSAYAGLDKFIIHRTAINLSPRTIRWYKHTLQNLFKDMETNGVDLTNVVNITTSDVQDYLVRQLNRGVKPVTLNGHVRALNAVLRFLQKEGLYTASKLPITKQIRHEKRILETFSESQIAKILKVCDNGRFTGLRDKTAIMLMLETGIRATELINIKVGDVNLHAGTIKVLGKGRKERIVPIQNRMSSQIQVYLAERGTNVATINLFVTVDDRPMTLRTFEQGITNLGMKAGISNVRVSPHTFRHTFAKLYIQNGGDVFSLQRILGHTSLEMVRNYVNLFSTEVFIQHAKFSPMEHMSLESNASPV